MTLLGETQTFFGTLLTFAVLQLFYQGKNSENYFIKLIEFISNDTIKNLRKSNDEVRAYNKKLLQYINKKKGSISLTENEIDSFSEDITVHAARLSILTLRLNQCEDKLKKISKIETPQLVALYLFFFGLIIMFIDLIPVHNNFTTGFITFYFVLSASFISTLWKEYYTTSKNMKIKKVKKFKKTIPLNLNSTLLSIVFSIFIVTCLFFLLYSASFYMLMIAIFLVFFSVGLCEEFYRTIDYNRHFILSHVVCILLTAVTLGILCQLWYSNNSLSYLWNESKAYIHIFRCALILFMIFNLIIIPLIITYLRYQEWKTPFFKELNSIRNWITIKTNEVKTWK